MQVPKFAYARIRGSHEGPRPGRRNHRKPPALGERAAAERASDGIARALERGWPGTPKSPAGELPSSHGSQNTAAPRAAPGSPGLQRAENRKPARAAGGEARRPANPATVGSDGRSEIFASGRCERAGSHSSPRSQAATASSERAAGMARTRAEARGSRRRGRQRTGNGPGRCCSRGPTQCRGGPARSRGGRRRHSAPARVCWHL